MGKRRVAFVVQRCGDNVNGGGEQHCLAIAKRMSSYWKTDILTTCALDYVCWENHYPTGREAIGDTTILRFPVAAPRDIDAFNRLSRDICERGLSVTSEEEESWMEEQGPRCPGLIEYLEKNADEYDVFIFFTYLYWHTWAGLPKVAARAILVPLAHDEWTIRLGIFRQLFAKARHYIFNSVEEKRFLQHLYPEIAFDGPVVGVAVDRPSDVDPTRFRRAFRMDNSFLLYLGRIDPSKGCGELFEYFLRHRSEGGLPKKLVLVGKAVMSIPQHPDIVSLGYLPHEMKWDALAACSALVMPSVNESLSLVLLEAWSVGKPVLVNGRCEVLVGQCKRSNGGLWYESYEEWTAAMRHLQSGASSSVLGRQGWRFVQDNYSWETIERAYLREVELVASKENHYVSE